MAESQQEIYTIFCLLVGEDVPFSIKIAKNETVGHSKGLIKEAMKPELDHIDANELDLYYMEITDDSHMTRTVIQRMSENPPRLRVTRKLEDIFDGNPKEETIYIVVVPPAKRKRSLSDTGGQAVKRAKLIKDIPSVWASSVKMRRITHLINGGQLAYNRPEAKCATIPIALAHQVFANFLEDCQHHEPTEKDNKWLATLRHDMLKQYANEQERCSRFRRIFEGNTDMSISEASIPGTTSRNDGHFIFANHFLLISVGKHEWVRLAADPQLQAFMYYIKTVKQTKVIKVSPMPCLIIYYIGTLIGFAGAVTTDKPYFEALTPLFDLATNQHDDLALKPVARALGAARAALDSLKKYYTELNRPQLFRPSTNLRFPSRNYYTDHNDARVEFDYQKRLDEDRLMFRALTGEGEKKLIIKFTQKYSKEAHAHCASHGIAPELYAVEKLGGGWMMVVMEEMDEDTYTHIHEFDATERAMIEEAVSILHQGNFVHGDIRDVNMMVRRNWDPACGSRNIKLLDFDWAGMEGTVRYPANVNHEDIRRPQDARDGLLITKEHDNTMVKFLL